MPAVVWVISTVSACGRRVDDRLRGPLVVLPPGRPALVLADRIWPEAQIKWRMLRDTILQVVVVACSPLSAPLVLFHAGLPSSRPVVGVRARCCCR